ncbi:hypothetical protein ONE63_002005 [Megalurothrips usitatus]|uniref:Uncharacterized protein n=1 Tax=Megalurothrips usitatus TaxID=439358 RepID=A0AAV7XA84_9NEOP|nr:hypothetical protein ONE63_002005 [Megalurothrips usitatus]
MELSCGQHSIPRLICFLESLLASTNQSKIGIEAHSSEAQKLLHGWILPERDAPDISCRCAESQKQQLNAFLEKVEKAVKYSQSIREGRSDVVNPWPEEIESHTCKVEDRKINTTKKSNLGNHREKITKGKIINGSHKRLSISTQSPQHKSTEDQGQLNSCPIHGISLSGSTKNIQTVGLAEALDVKGIPPELVTILKSVHQYINRLRTTNLKNRSEASFIRHLHSMNESRWSKFTSSGLFDKLPTYSSEGCSGKIPFEEDEDEEGHTPSQSSSESSGIWNPAITNMASVGAFCVQYQSEEIWNLLQMRMQQLQLSHAEWQICDILSCDPLLCNPDMHYPAASLFLKAATALSKLTCLNLPVLVKPGQ